MSDTIEEIRRWHKLNRDTTSQHWQHVDLLLSEVDNALGSFTKDDLDSLISDLESAHAEIGDAIHALRPTKNRKRAA